MQAKCEPPGQKPGACRPGCGRPVRPPAAAPRGAPASPRNPGGRAGCAHVLEELEEEVHVGGHHVLVLAEDVHLCLLLIALVVQQLLRAVWHDTRCSAGSAEKRKK